MPTLLLIRHGENEYVKKHKRDEIREGSLFSKLPWTDDLSSFFNLKDFI